jgi:cysteinyl-tRNA synthetase
MVRYWMHGGLLRVDGDKMSKSLGNFSTIRDALEVTDVRTLRYAFLSQHYRSSIELSEVTLDNARNARRRVENFGRTIDTSVPESPAAVALADRTRTRFFERLDDDFDAPGALAALFDYVREQNRSDEKPGRSAHDLLHEVEELFEAFDLTEQKTDDTAIDAELEQRRELRKARQFAEADAIRDSLAARGIVIEDTADGTRWWYEER